METEDEISVSNLILNKLEIPAETGRRSDYSYRRTIEGDFTIRSIYQFRL